MRYVFQDGSVVQLSDFELSVDAEVSYAGLWRSLNDRQHYRLSTSGFGQYDQTHTRKTVQSSFYSGSYTTRTVKDSTSRTWGVLVRGVDQGDLEEALSNLVTWFEQDFYNLRVKKNEVVETLLAEKADYTIDQSHVFLHNCMAMTTFKFSVRPTISREIVL